MTNRDNPHARALRRALADVGISRAELARRLDVSEQWVHRRAWGQTPATTTDLDRIAAALGCRVRDLLPPDRAGLEERP